MELSKLIVSQTPREVAGGRTINRFNFQQHWTLCKLLELHVNEEEYVVICDYHEDVLVVDSPETPSQVRPFQIKSKKPSNWTPASLVKVKQSEGSSILGKLVGGIGFLSNHIDKFYFVSNASLTSKLESEEPISTLREIAISSLVKKDRDKIYKSLDEELKLKGKRPTIVFLISDISVDDQENHVKGKILKFLNDHLQNDGSSTSALYQALGDEIRRCSSKEVTYDDFKKLCDERGISKEKIGTMLTRVTSKENVNILWGNIDSDLKNENVIFTERQSLKQNFLNYNIQRVDLSNDALQSYRQEVESKIASILTNANTSLLGIVEEVMDECPSDIFEEKMKYAMILREIYECQL